MHPLNSHATSVLPRALSSLTIRAVRVTSVLAPKPGLLGVLGHILATVMRRLVNSGTVLVILFPEGDGM